MPSKLEMQFHAVVMADVRAVQALGYNPTRFLSMINADGAASTARVLLRTDKFHDGLGRLRQLDALDHSIEARALEARWETLFTDADRDVARRRLRAMGHQAI